VIQSHRDLITHLDNNMWIEVRKLFNRYYVKFVFRGYTEQIECSEEFYEKYKNERRVKINEPIYQGLRR